MISTRTLASATVVAISAFSGRPAAATVAARMTAVREEGGAVTALSVVPNERTTDVVIRVNGPITFNHFTLTKPDKIVVDVNNATLGLPTTDAYDGVARGAIKGVRYSQFTKSIVRVVVTLDAAHPYGVLQNKGELRIQIDGGGENFAAWSLGSTAERQAVADAQPSQDPVADAIVTQTRTRAPAAVIATRNSPSATRAQQSQEPRITINWDRADINEVLGIFASYTNRTILPSRAVQGTISANIVNLPWDVALKEVMNANGYDVTVNPDGVIVIDTFENLAARQSTIPLQTRTVRLNYARAAAVAPMVAVRLTHTCPVTPQQQAMQPPAITPAPSNMPAPGGAMTVPAQPNAGATPAPQQPGASINNVQNLQCTQRGAVIADTITNSVAITDVPSALDDLERYARSLDVRQPQVNIKAKIILVDRTTLEGLGLRYDLGTPEQFFNDVVPRLDSAGKPLTTAGQILLGGNTVSAIANASARVPSAALQLVFSTAMGNYDFTTFLEALQTNTLLDVQAEPSATVLNNRVANLTAGTEVPIRVIDAGASTAGNNSSLPRATVQFRQTGVILQVVPQITNNRQVQMKVHVENSSVQFQTSDVGAVFPKQSVDNEMLVADGETMVVGGLTQTEVNLTKTGLPVLVDLPIIGRLFGVTNRTETKRDLLILITPHIIDEGTTPGSGRP